MLMLVLVKDGDLDTRGSGVYVLPPREKDGTKFDVYQGTADAITSEHRLYRYALIQNTF